MVLDQMRFKAKLDGTLERRIFKAKLLNRDMIIDSQLKMIVPLKDYSNMTSFMDTLASFIHMDYSSRRLHNSNIKTLRYLKQLPQRVFICYMGGVFTDRIVNI